MSAGRVNVGGILSITVTTAVPEVMFPLASVAVRVTVLGPILLQLKVLGTTTKVKGQLS